MKIKKKRRITKKWLRNTIIVFILCLALPCAVIVLGINGYVKSATKKQIITPEEAAKLKDVDCILVLGCGIREDGTPTPMLEDRMNCGISLYQNKTAPKLLLSGDNGQVEYNEVATMLRLATEAGVPSKDVFLDHAGFSTYESVFRAKEIFKAKKILIVTQEYHLYRSLYIANKLEIEAYGVSCNARPYPGQTMRDIREILARNKDAVKCIFKPNPTFLGDAIPVSGDGTSTH